MIKRKCEFCLPVVFIGLAVKLTSEAKLFKKRTDGIISCASAHIDFAVSEKLVPSGHYAHKHPVAIAEVKRILNLHLNELSTPTIAKINRYKQLAPSLIMP